MKLWNFRGCRRRRRSEENGFFDEEWRPEKLRGCFKCVIDDIGRPPAPSAQLRGSAMHGFKWFWPKLVDSWNFGWFWMRQAFVGDVSGSVSDVGNSRASSAQLKCSEMGVFADSEYFWLKTGAFSTLWSSFMNSADVERISGPVTTVVGTGDSLCDFKLK